MQSFLPGNWAYDPQQSFVVAAAVPKRITRQAIAVILNQRLQAAQHGDRLEPGDERLTTEFCESFAHQLSLLDQREPIAHLQRVAWRALTEELCMVVGPRISS